MYAYVYVTMCVCVCVCDYAYVHVIMCSGSLSELATRLKRDNAVECD